MDTKIPEAIQTNVPPPQVTSEDIARGSLPCDPTPPIPSPVIHPMVCDNAIPVITDPKVAIAPNGAVAPTIAPIIDIHSSTSVGKKNSGMTNVASTTIAKSKSKPKRKIKEVWLEDTEEQDAELERRAQEEDELDSASDLDGFIINDEEYDSDDDKIDRTQGSMTKDFMDSVKNLPAKRTRKPTQVYVHPNQAEMDRKYEEQKQRRDRARQSRDDEEENDEDEDGAPATDDVDGEAEDVEDADTEEFDNTEDENDPDYVDDEDDATDETEEDDEEDVEDAEEEEEEDEDDSRKAPKAKTSKKSKSSSVRFADPPTTSVVPIAKPPKPTKRKR